MMKMGHKDPFKKTNKKHESLNNSDEGKSKVKPKSKVKNDSNVS
jgi:hypothetical protein